ncbi:MAG: hotdog fold thioesterase [Flavobacteriales bacterium]
MHDILEKANWYNENTMLGALGIRITHIAEGHVEATMPVDHRTHQPYGQLHGGASAALAETIASIGSQVIAGSEAYVVGVELNINHLRAKREGVVTGIARVVHAGRSTHIWNIEIKDEEKKLIAVSRLTVLVKSKQI